jgi:hypothetical protein
MEYLIKKESAHFFSIPGLPIPFLICIFPSKGIPKEIGFGMSHAVSKAQNHHLPSSHTPLVQGFLCQEPQNRVEAKKVAVRSADKVITDTRERTRKGDCCTRDNIP